MTGRGTNFEDVGVVYKSGIRAGGNVGDNFGLVRYITFSGQFGGGGASWDTLTGMGMIC